jgi:hypothetical protein
MKNQVDMIADMRVENERLKAALFVQTPTERHGEYWAERALLKTENIQLRTDFNRLRQATEVIYNLYHSKEMNILLRDVESKWNALRAVLDETETAGFADNYETKENK